MINSFFTLFPFLSIKETLILFIVCSGVVLVLFGAVFLLIRKRIKEGKKERELFNVIKRLVGQSGDIYYILDIRDKKEYEKGHLPTAINVPFNEIGQFFPTEKMFSRIIVCGERVSEVKKAARELSDRAYFRVDLINRLSKWDGEWEIGPAKKTEKK